MATVAELIVAIGTDRHNVGVYLAALAKGPLNAHQAASLETDLRTLDANLAALSAALAPAPTAPATPAPIAPAGPISDKIANETPYTGPTVGGAVGAVAGVSCLGAATADAEFLANQAVGLDHPSPYPGACAALGWSGVMGAGSGEHYVVFKYGAIVAVVPGNSTTDVVAVANANGVGPDISGRILRLAAA